MAPGEVLAPLGGGEDGWLIQPQYPRMLQKLDIRPTFLISIPLYVYFEAVEKKNPNFSGSFAAAG